jgi:hypothetical protein
MYDTKFIVKYHDIQEDLNIILKEKEDQYSSQDILDICNKLYRDELCSVFYAEDIIDDKIDKGMQTVFDIMLVNPDFKAIIDKKKELLLLKETKNVELGLELESDTINLESVNLDAVNLEILLTLFSENIFYITHKCICQQITTGRIDTELLLTLVAKLI